MLTRRATSYIEIVLVYLAISSQFILEVCAAAENSKKISKTPQCLNCEKSAGGVELFDGRRPNIVM